MNYDHALLDSERLQHSYRLLIVEIDAKRSLPPTNENLSDLQVSHRKSTAILVRIFRNLRRLASPSNQISRSLFLDRYLTAKRFTLSVRDLELKLARHRTDDAAVGDGSGEPEKPCECSAASSCHRKQIQLKFEIVYLTRFSRRLSRLLEEWTTRHHAIRQLRPVRQGGMREWEINAMTYEFTYDEEMEACDRTANELCPICQCGRECGQVVMELWCFHLFHEQCGRQALLFDCRCAVCRDRCV